MRNNLELWSVVTIGAIISTILSFFGSNIWLNTELISDLIVFISVAFGFFATSLAIFATSSYSGKLYDIEDQKSGGTLLHVLVNKYRTGLFACLLSIVYLIVLEIFLDGNKIQLSNLLVSPVLGTLFVNLYYAYRLVEIVSKFVIQEAKRS